MASAARKHRRDINFASRLCALISLIIACTFFGVITAEPVKDDDDPSNPQEDTSQVTSHRSFSLDKKRERSKGKIRLKNKVVKPLDPTEIQVTTDKTTIEEGQLSPSIALIHGLIQKIILDKDTYEQGEVATLNVTTVLPLTKPEITFLYRTYKLYQKADNNYQTVLAVPMHTEPGEYTMKLEYIDKEEQKELAMPFTVIPGYFSESDTAELDVHVLTEETLEMLKYEGNYFARAYRVNPDSILYDSTFIWPCSGTITGLYGTPRQYNEDLDKWSHKAIDFANRIGTKVYAANSGVIAMAEDLDVHGNSIVIAHGGGVHTVYIHLDTLCVKKGQNVKKGQLIGKLGDTGLCTGPNLHWQVMVNRVATNPRFWLEGKPEIKQKQWVQYKKP